MFRKRDHRPRGEVVAVESNMGTEIVKPAPRVVVYGQLPYRIDPISGEASGGAFSGSREITNALIDFLRGLGMSDDGIVASRDVANIENAFFRGRRADLPEQAVVVDSIPDAVFVLPVMRGYEGGGHSLNTPIHKIEALCTEHDVPMIVVDTQTTLDDLNAHLGQIPFNTLPEIHPGQPQ